MVKKLLLVIGIFVFLQASSQNNTYNCFFQSNSAKYQSDSILNLHNWISSNLEEQTVRLELLAYTDTIGSIEYNDQLANKRLENIAEILKSKGYSIANSKIIGKRYATNQYSSNADFRKVEILVYENPPKIVWIENDSTSALEKQQTEDYFKSLPNKNTAPALILVNEFETLGDNKIINLNIEFQNGTDLYSNKQSEKQVFYLGEYLKKHPNKKVMILGHVCCSGNYAVSNMRAKKVYADLIKYKIKKKRMKYKGLSNTRPLVDEVDATTEQQNRRVEVFFYE